MPNANNDTIGLYLHIPFCRQKCLYCDFPSFAGREDAQEAYTAALAAEIAACGEKYKGRRVGSVFFGGGTPTVLPIPLLERLMRAVWENWDVAADAEITAEANPGTLDLAGARALRGMGFNRLSMGVQAWQDRLLRRLGRIHTIAGFLETYDAVRRAGFENVNLDLMFALPEQTMADWQETLRQAVALAPEHLSAYSLIIEEGTPFFAQYEAGALRPAAEELDREMYHWTVAYLAEQGYGQYEISNFAKAGRQSRHNRIYWQAEEYLGMGLGAHSYMEGKRFHRETDLQAYLQAGGAPQEFDVEEIGEADAMAEFLFLGLRLTEGVSFARFAARFGREMRAVYGRQIDTLTAQRLLTADEKGICLTARGVDVSNHVFAEFLP